ncbi:MAG: LD-carboxypeptidase [Pedobacter sp.]|nr:LD-carboxypeptidase [Pedobacter sp.]MDQ8052608.1 LD-carboxypeptidase [Pedobacter sp.]
MIKQPPYLKNNDKIAIVCPAKKLPNAINEAIDILKDWGLQVEIGKTVSGSHHQFAGTDELRAADLQQYLDDPSIKAIIAGRGGYGTLRIIDDLDFTAFEKNPKWLIGFSDITVLLSHVFAVLETQSIHAQMPYTFDTSSAEALTSLKNTLFGHSIVHTYESQFKNREGNAEGVLIGGNLSLLIAVQGSVSEMDYTDKILFLEEVSEHEYSIDRMMRILKRNGKLNQLKGLIIGAFNDLGEESIPFGQTPEEIIWELVKEYDYPVCFNFPTGHIDDNRAMVVGRNVALQVNKLNVELKFL